MALRRATVVTHSSNLSLKFEARFSFAIHHRGNRFFRKNEAKSST